MNIYLRKGWRLCALVFPLIYIRLSSKEIILILGVFSLCVLLLDILRFFYPPLASFFSRVFSKISREKEARSLSSTTVFLLVILACFVVFPKKIAILASVFSIVGDSFSTIVGQRFARIKFKGKSLEGSLGFFASSLCAGFILKNPLGIDLRIIFLGAGLGALIEFLSLPPVDDNISVPLLTGGILWLVK